MVGRNKDVGGFNKQLHVEYYTDPVNRLYTANWCKEHIQAFRCGARNR